MYKLLLCWRYLRTRYIALASIVSVTLGVATMVVVNAVMSGAHEQLLEQLHGIHSDLEVQVRSMEGAPDAEAHMAKIRQIAGDQIAGMSPTVRVPAMLGYYIGEQYHTQQMMVIGVDQATYAQVSDFGQFLQHPENRARLSFDLKDGGYDMVDHRAEDQSAAKVRHQLEGAGWPRRRAIFGSYQPAAVEAPAVETTDPFAGSSAYAVEEFNPAKKQHIGCVLGIGLASYKTAEGADIFVKLPGDDVEITYPSAGRPPKPLSAKFTVVDFYESKSNYDTAFVIVPLDKLQSMRGMFDPETGKAHFTAIQIKLKPGANLNEVRDQLRGKFQENYYLVSTWLEKQGPLLAAIQVETAVLNVLLFLIIAVAGFGILAIFYMIVVEKTRDIGILKSLGASSGGVMSIFVSYGVLLGIVGSGVGVVGGLLFVAYINEIAAGIGALLGMKVFDPAVYDLAKIPTIVEPFTVTWITAGAVLIAVLASVLPARRAAAMHPVAALRWE